MSEKGLLESRERALENAFFARQDEALLARMRNADRAIAERAALAAATGIGDTAVLDHWVAMGFRANSLAALSLVPLVMVAWAEGPPDEEEKRTVRAVAQEAGLDKDNDTAQLLEGWLATRPTAELETAWREYAAAIAAAMPEATREAFRRDTLARARRVAETSRGFMGLGNPISSAERRVLDRLAEVLGA